MIEVTEEEKKLIRERFASRHGVVINDLEAISIVRGLKESHRWKQFIRRER